MEKRQDPPSNRQMAVMRWMSFLVINILFVAAVIKNIISDTSTDKYLAVVFIIITGFAWGANIWKYFIKTE